jgi:hypothetical protein
MKTGEKVNIQLNFCLTSATHTLQTNNMHAACTLHAHAKHLCCMQATQTHRKHALSMPYDGCTHTTNTMNICIHAPQGRWCEHACMHDVWMRGCSMHACSVRHACSYGVQASSLYSCWEGEGIVLVPYLLQNCPTI